MCIAFLAIECHSQYPLVILANRDESFQRPTEGMHWWDRSPKMLAGKDVLAGGTWFGVNERKEVGLLTNFREPQVEAQGLKSRGELVTDYLQARHGDFESYLQESREEFAGYNLVFGSPEKLWHFNNREGLLRELGVGLHGLSNATLDTPWPKVERGKALTLQALRSEKLKPQQLFEILTDKERPTDQSLPATGLPLELERGLSSIFIESQQGYGSRSATLLLVDKDGVFHLWERDYLKCEQRSFRF